MSIQPAISDYLKYVRLQLAAEAFLIDDSTGLIKSNLEEALIEGNNHASMFTETEATDFLQGWQVVAQQANASSGFSGTLFKNRETNELVISFRSTEFIDDAARDSQATNSLEIAEHGFAFGQIADMETWYAKLVSDGDITDPSQLSVTGYSLGVPLRGQVLPFAFRRIAI